MTHQLSPAEQKEFNELAPTCFQYVDLVAVDLKNEFRYVDFIIKLGDPTENAAAKEVQCRFIFNKGYFVLSKKMGSDAQVLVNSPQSKFVFARLFARKLWKAHQTAFARLQKYRLDKKAREEAEPPKHGFPMPKKKKRKKKPVSKNQLGLPGISHRRRDGNKRKSTTRKAPA